MPLRDYFLAIAPSGQSLTCLFLLSSYAKLVNGNPSGSQSGNRSKKAFLEEWVFVGGDASDEQNVMDFPVLHSTDHTDCIRDDHPPTPRPLKQPDSLLWEPTRPQDKAYFWERIEAPLPPLRPQPKCNFIHPRQLSPFPERLELPFSNDEILCTYEVIVSSGTDQFTAWVKMSPHEVLVQHMVDIQKATADFREASERKTYYIFSYKQCQQTFCYPINCAEETQHLQLEPWG